MVENDKMIISNATLKVIFKQYAFAKKGKNLAGFLQNMQKMTTIIKNVYRAQKWQNSLVHF